MMIKVSELEETGLTVDDVAALSPAFREATWRLEDVRVRVEPQGADVLVHGRLRATVPQTCGRCLEAFRAPVSADVDLRVVPAPATADSVELGADDLDVDFYENDQLDLGRLLETEVTLALPMRALCRGDCRGLCPVCGANRNTAPCACEERPPDARLAVLRTLRGRAEQ